MRKSIFTVTFKKKLKGQDMIES